VLNDKVGKQEKELASARSEREQVMAIENSRATNTAVVNFLKGIGVASRFFAETNGHIFPTGLGQIQDNLIAQGFGNQTGTVEIEFLDYGQPISTSANPILFFAREKQPRQMPDGTWSRAYLSVDGAVQTATADSADFGGWEQQWNLHISRSGAPPGLPAGQNAQ